ncbi:Coiled-coil domain-containing protein 39 [Coelomomyces lativittatus]|nr:Coiled-coil domain-containing protein 39 [Coelomomyces lativittatus]KAJ1512361.1 Coiled-coil domain-containing protein 39 [Coelomomyces lativittatus]
MLRDTSSKEEKAEVLQTYLRQQESKNKELEKKTKYLKEREFKYTQELFKYRQDEKTLSSEISGAHAAIRNLTSKVNQLDQASIQQRTLLYHQEYTLQQVERKLKRAQGERTDEEKEQLNAKIQMLNAQYEQAQQTYHLLHTQLKKSQDDLRHSKRKYEVLEKEKGSLDEQLDELQLYSTSAQHQLQSKIKEKEELMVEESVLKLELNKLRGFLNARADEVLGLEARQVQLRLALEERSKEIEIHQSMLKGQLRACEEEKSEYTQEVKEKMAQVERKKTRFDIWMSQLGTTDDPIEEEERTQAFYIIKAAQQREDLQRQGDQLDLAIQKAEKEIKAMENTLIVLNHRNENFKVNLNQSDVLPEDIEHQQSLQLQFQTAQDKLTQKQQALEKQQREFMELETQLTQLNEIENQQQQTVTQLEQQSHLYVKQIQDQQSKKKRMEQTVSRLVKEYRKMKSGSVHDLTLEEEDIQQKQAKEMLRFIMYRVEEILSRKASTEVMDKLHQFYLNVGLQPPSRPMTQLSHLSDTSSFHASSKPSKGNHASRTSSRASSNQLENLTQGNPSPNAFKSTSVNNNNPWTATSLKPRSDTSVGPHMATFQFNLTPKSTSNSETSSLQARKHALSKMTLPSTGSMNKHALGIEICSPAKALPSLPGPSPAAPHKPSSYHPTFLRQGSARTPHQ